MKASTCAMIGFMAATLFGAYAFATAAFLPKAYAQYDGAAGPTGNPHTCDTPLGDPHDDDDNPDTGNPHNT